MPINPYTAEAGPELDRLVHLGFVKPAIASGPYPAYSTDIKLTKRILAKLRTGPGSVIVGRTTLEGRSWFARYERDATDGIEVFADTYELAVCRLALLQVQEDETGR